MKEIENIVSSFVESQFPDFYQAEGPRFIEFLKQYYKWMESQNQALNASRNLFDIRDIDKTSADFLVYFKQKYFNQLPFSLQANTQLLTKFATDFYNVKGTTHGIELILRGIFDEEASVTYPNEKIFRLSHGDWVRPVYLELSISDKTKDFVGKEIKGFNSNARAFVEAVVRRRIQTKIIDVAYLSSIRGDFQTGENITLSSNTTIEGTPTVTGSLNELEIINGGALFNVGDVFLISSSNGKQGKARVAAISDAAGTVTFVFESPLTSGGWGYQTNSTTIVSSKVLTVKDQTNSNGSIIEFSRFEDVQQVLANIAYDTATPDNSEFVPGVVIENYDGGGAVVANAVIVSVGTTGNTSGYIVVSPRTGNIASIDTTFSVKGNTTTAVITSYTDRTVTANVVGSNSSLKTLTVNASENISSSQDTVLSLNHGLINNQIVRYLTPIGNTAISGLSNNTFYFVANTTNTTFQLSTSYNGSIINLTAKGTSENGHIFQTRTGYIGVYQITGGGAAFVASPFANVVGLTSNTTAIIANTSSGSGADFSVGTITDTESVFLNPDFIANKNLGNVAFYNVRLNGYNANTDYFGSDATFNANSNVRSAEDDIELSTANNYSANVPILYVVDTGNTAVSPLVTNTVYYIDTSNATHVTLKATKTGSRIELTPSSTSETGHHLIGPLEEITEGDQPNTIAFRGLGFPKYPGSSMDSVLLDCLRFVSTEIGSIASLAAINPGADYNIDPFVAVIEPLVRGYNRRDYLMGIDVLSGSFVEGEQVEQSISLTTTLLTVNTFSAVAANGSSPTNYESLEFVYQEYANGSIRASGFVREAGVSSGSGVVRLANVTGTFVVTSNSSTYVKSITTNSVANIQSISTGTSTTRARALIKSGSNTSILKLKRINLENTFIVDPSATLVGRTSGATANVLSIGVDLNSEFIGVNANIIANVASSNGVASELEVIDSGFGYIDDETLTLSKEGSVFEITAVARLKKQGTGEGFFLSTQGFLDADKKIHDNDYYQQFSYEIESKIPFEQYFSVLKELAHVAGTKAFGSISSLSVIDSGIIVNSEIMLEESEGAYVHSYTKAYTAASGTSYSTSYSGAYQETLYTGAYSKLYTGLYTTTFSKQFTQAYSQAYSNFFNQTFTQRYTVDYTRLFTAFYLATFTIEFTKTVSYTGNFTPIPYTPSYTSTYSKAWTSLVPYTKFYTRQIGLLTTIRYTRAYTGINTKSFTKIYTGPSYSASTSYTNNFDKVSYSSDNFVGTYSTIFGNVYAKLFSGSYEGNTFHTAFWTTSGYTRAFTRGTFTRSFSGYTRIFARQFNRTYGKLYYTPVSYTATFAAASYTSAFGSYSSTYALYTRIFGGFTSNYSRNWTATFLRNYTLPYTKEFSGSFAASFSGNYTNTFTKAYTTAAIYTNIYSGIYTGAYSGFTPLAEDYTNSYTSNFTEVGFTKTFTNVYVGTYGKFTRAYSLTFSGSYSKQYTIIYGGASFTSNIYSGTYGTS